MGNLLGNVAMELLRLAELGLSRSRERLLALLSEARDHVDIITEVEPKYGPVETLSVDSGFAVIHYHGMELGIVNCAALLLGSRSRVFSRLSLINNEGPIEEKAMGMEVEFAAGILRELKVPLVLMDGPLLGRGSLNLLAAAKSVLGYVKEARASRYSQLLDGDAGVFFRKWVGSVREGLLVSMIMELRRREGSRGVLITKPVKLREEGILGFYVQYTPRSLPVYVESLGDYSVVVDSVARLASLSISGYPLPLYLVDKLARVSGELRNLVSTMLERLGNEVLGRMRNLYLGPSLNHIKWNSHTLDWHYQP